MTVDSLLLVLVPTLAALGTLILGLGQQQHALSLVAIFAAITSAVFTDWLKWYRLHPIFANMAALAAVGYSFLRFSDGASETQLLSVANLLIYLQVILLYQQKNIRIYWHICLLSLLQVVVAAALELGPQFGALLVVYMFFTLLTLTLLFMRGESLSQFELSQRSAAPLTPGAGPHLDTTGPVEFSNRDSSVASFENSMLNRQLFLRLVMLGLSTLIMTTVLFFLMPRFGSDEFGDGGKRAERLVGFSPQLSLGEIGRTLESPEIVMRAQFTNGDGTPFNVLVDPYFRGNVLSKYIPQQGIWLDAGESFYVRNWVLAPAPQEQAFVHQTIVLETESPLFSVFPVYATPQSDPLGLREDQHRLLLKQDEDQAPRRQRKYSVATTTFRNGIQRRLTPAHRSSRQPGRIGPLIEFRRASFPKLVAIARQLVDESQVEPGDHQAMAKLLESHFKATGGYTYTLTQTTLPPRGVDPIEHFVSESHRGHCEYFASALAMMLRSLDIPARVVVGFHGGEYNRMGHFFLVRQLHAHAWVEAYITKQQLEEFNNFDEVATANGAWLRLDPTPGNGTHNVDVARGGVFKRLSQVGDFLEVLWKDYVVGLNSTRQREAIYRPIVQRTSASLRDGLLNREWWVLFATELRASLGLDSVESFRQRWVNWRSVPLLAAIFFGILLIHRIWRRISPIVMPWLAKRLHIRRRSWTKDPQLAWFHRLERYFARRGYRRKPGQTHREFVFAASQSLADPERKSALTDVAGQLVDGFYRVRFGRQRLSSSELHALEQSARQLESTMR